MAMRRVDLESMTKQELLELARKHDIAGRSQLSKDGLIRALMKEAEAKRRPAFDRPARPKDESPRAPQRRGAAGARETASAKRAAPKPAAAGTRSRSERPAAGKRAVQPAATAKREQPAAQAKAGRAEPRAKVAAQGRAPEARGRDEKAARTPRAAARAGTGLSRREALGEPRARVITPPPEPESRAERAGPFGPASERLHGGTAPRAMPAPPAGKRPRAQASRRRAERTVEAEPAPAAAPAPPAAAGVGSEAAASRRGLGAPLVMPGRYGHTRAVLMARDPHWLHAYWEITPEAVAGLRNRLGDEWSDQPWVLRVFAFGPGVDFEKAEEGNGEDRYDIELPAGADNWYLNVGRPDRVYRYAVGVISRGGVFHALARSNAVHAPRDTISAVTDEEWTRAPESYRRLYEMMGEGLKDGRSSGELGLLLRERLRADWSSGMLGSMASGALARPAESGPGFWFVLDAELIVYGATEPDASVTVQGRPVRLRPDGTFSLRFQLPDGTQVIDATAVSADSLFRKTITPTVRRETNATETVEARMES